MLISSLIGLSIQDVIAQPTANTKPHIGIIGAGTVGATLGTLFIKAGYPVMFSSRHPEELQDLAKGLGPLASTGTPLDASSYGSIILLAVPYKALPQLGAALHNALNGKIVIDATNPYTWRDGELANRAIKEGVGVTSASIFPEVRLVRAFNSMSTLTIAQEAGRSGAHLAIPIAGDDSAALRIISTLINDIGLEPVTVGGLAKARDFQPGAPGWQVIGTATELRNHLNLK